MKGSNSEISLSWLIAERRGLGDGHFLIIGHNIKHTILIENYFDLSNGVDISWSKNPDRLDSDH